MVMFKSKIMLARWALLIGTLGMLSACSDAKNAVPNLSQRWYTPEQLAQGKAVFADHCAACHGPMGEGVANWQTLDANGLYPAPPLDGSAHAWHHSLNTLIRTISAGGGPLGGSMPGFQGSLTEAEQKSVIAAFQAHWSDDIYSKWKIIDSR